MRRSTIQLTSVSAAAPQAVAVSVSHPMARSAPSGYSSYTPHMFDRAAGELSSSSPGSASASLARAVRGSPMVEADRQHSAGAPAAFSFGKLLSSSASTSSLPDLSRSAVREPMRDLATNNLGRSLVEGRRHSLPVSPTELLPAGHAAGDLNKENSRLAPVASAPITMPLGRHNRKRSNSIVASFGKATRSTIDSALQAMQQSRPRQPEDKLAPLTELPRFDALQSLPGFAEIRKITVQLRASDCSAEGKALSTFWEWLTEGRDMQWGLRGGGPGIGGGPKVASAVGDPLVHVEGALACKKFEPAGMSPVQVRESPCLSCIVFNC